MCAHTHRAECAGKFIARLVSSASCCAQLCGAALQLLAPGGLTQRGMLLSGRLMLSCTPACISSVWEEGGAAELRLLSLRRTYDAYTPYISPVWVVMGVRKQPCRSSNSCSCCCCCSLQYVPLLLQTGGDRQQLRGVSVVLADGEATRQNVQRNLVMPL